MTITSPNTVLANALNNVLDLFEPRIRLMQPKRVEFVVGTQINGVPHIGTYTVVTGAFVLAQQVRDRYQLPVEVKFGALDNAPYETVQSPEGVVYQRTYGHAINFVKLMDLVHGSYLDYMNKLVDITHVPYSWSTYVAMQQDPEFRRQFLRVLEHYEELRWVTAPSTGEMRVRIPCPQCNLAEKYAASTNVLSLDADRAMIEAVCFTHGRYMSEVLVDGSDDVYLDLNTLLRNVVKEAQAAEQKDVLSVMVKGGDWVMSTALVDWGLGLLGYTSEKCPMRFFTPEIVTSTGAKLSKSLIRDGDVTLDDVPDWIMDMRKFCKIWRDDAPQRMVWLIEQFLSNPRHAFRAYSYTEIMRILSGYGAK